MSCSVLRTRRASSRHIKTPRRVLLTLQHQIQNHIPMNLHQPLDTAPCHSSRLRRRQRPQQHYSRWDQIRAANARNPGTSSWDTLRQSHERVSVQRSQFGVSTNPDEFARNDQATEQARFDALLEQERNFGQPTSEFQKKK
ncbi:hypothetical protein EDD18DRAFT_20996 [Armillaria luteobubalina]|uniref:Uncharacterized protein n=1 Tax=Armillaria luteobubalina TaxID=153913 RepID=A0AA39QQT1_9AGAR|nr:hypothetical protein EDD18DRAFT_20996 [Armillaria luteobubalina]